MTQEEARDQFLRFNRWRQLLLYQEFFQGGLLPWQEQQLRCYRDEMERLDPIAHPESWAALAAFEERADAACELAEKIEATVRYFKAVAAGEEYDSQDRDVVAELMREIGEDL